MDGLMKDERMGRPLGQMVGKLVNGWIGFHDLNLLYSPDPFVKIQLLHGLKLVKTKKTSFLRGTIDPFYNELFSFKVPQEELENASLVFTGR